ncbi:MAG: ribosome-associated protein, partial [Abditibacteriota bacterium]|nr:ribosome-associated protein [Abditibacteriota bacterium]
EYNNAMIEITPTLAISENEIQEEFVRSSGAGGQNVNKVATAVQLRFDAAHSPSLSDDMRRRLKRLAGQRMTAEGVLIIKAQSQRTQERNRQDALERLVELLQQASIPPTPRRPTKPTRASQQRRIEAKRRQSQAKQLRRSLPNSDD